MFADYIDASKQDVSQELQKLGGAKIILSTVFDSKSMSSVFSTYTSLLVYVLES